MPNSLSIKRNMMWNTAGSLLYSGCQWLVTVMTARLSTDYEAAGVLAIAMAVSNIFAQVALYRMRSFQVSDIHEEITSSEYVATRFVTIGAGFIATCAYMILTCSPSIYPAVILYLVYRAGDVYIDVLHGIDQQHFRMDYCGKSMIMRAVFSTIGFCFTLCVFDSLELAIASMIVTTYPIIIYDLRRSSRLSDVRPKFNWDAIASLLKRCLPAVVGMSLCSNYIYAPLLGVFAEDFDERNYSVFIKHLLGVVVALVGIFFLGGIAFALFGDWLIGLVFGSQLVPYSYLMYAGLLCSSLTACVAFLSDLLIALRDMKGTLMGNAVGFFVSLPATWGLVRSFGMNGLSYSISFSYAVALAIMIFRISRVIQSNSIATSE